MSFRSYSDLCSDLTTSTEIIPHVPKLHPCPSFIYVHAWFQAWERGRCYANFFFQVTLEWSQENHTATPGSSLCFSICFIFLHKDLIYYEEKRLVPIHTNPCASQHWKNKYNKQWTTSSCSPINHQLLQGTEFSCLYCTSKCCIQKRLAWKQYSETQDHLSGQLFSMK